MTKAEVLKTIKREKLVPVIRTNLQDEARQAINILADCGIKVFEITMTVPNAVELINEFNSTNSDILVGAGTVLDENQAELCINAGAKFIVSPAFDPKTVRICLDKDVPVLPGTLTPSEILAAHKAGADCVKVFPCDVLGGAKYLKNLKTLFPHIEMIPTGGVNLESIADFFQAGAFAVGVGTDLVDFDAIRENNPETIADKANEYLRKVNLTG